MFKKFKKLFCMHQFEVLSLDVYSRLNWCNEPNGNYQINYTAECSKCSKLVSDVMDLASVSSLTYSKSEDLVLKKLN